MSRRQRLTFLAIAAAIAVVAVVVLVSAGGDETASTTAPTSSTATPTPTATSEPSEAEATAEPTETPEPTATPKPQVPVLRAGEVTKLRVTEGDTVRFRVRSDTPEEVHVHGYDVLKEVGPGRPASFAFEATITGIFEVELELSHQQIAQLRVDPR